MHHEIDFTIQRQSFDHKGVLRGHLEPIELLYEGGVVCQHVSSVHYPSCQGRYSNIDGSDISMLLPVPARPFKNINPLYSWAYHKYEVLGRKFDGLEGELLKAHCRAKANQVTKLYGHICKPVEVCE